MIFKEINKLEKILFILLIFIFWLQPGFTQKLPLWEEKISAEIKFQNQFAELLLKKIPAAKDLVIINRDLQVTLYEIKRERYIYIINSDPARINTGKESNFLWTGKDEKKLLSSNKKYKDLIEKKNELMSKSQGHPLWPELKEAMKEVEGTKEYKKIFEELQSVLNKS